ncbi:MAG: UvrD-helicase domain-containing protein, partial [Acidimicrobiales bacterium]
MFDPPVALATTALEINPDQTAAVQHRGSPLLVVAGAGTGKTRTLTARVV